MGKKVVCLFLAILVAVAIMACQQSSGGSPVVESPRWESLAVSDLYVGFGAGTSHRLGLVFSGAGDVWLSETGTSYSGGGRVVRVAGGALETVGVDFNGVEGATELSACRDAGDALCVAYCDYSSSYRAVVKRYDGSDWNALGPDPLCTGAIYATSLNRYGSGLLFSVCDFGAAANERAKVFAWDGSAWILLGGAALPAASCEFMVSLVDPQGMPWAATVEDDGVNSRSLVVRYYEGGAWTQAGSTVIGLVVALRSIDIVSLDDGSICVCAQTSGVPFGPRPVRFMRWQGSSWAQLGPDLVPPMDPDTYESEIHLSSVAVSPDGTVCVAFDSLSDFRTRVYRLSGNEWLELSRDGFPEGKTIWPDLAFGPDGYLYLAVADSDAYPASTDYARPRVLRYAVRGL